MVSLSSGKRKYMYMGDPVAIVSLKNSKRNSHKLKTTN